MTSHKIDKYRSEQYQENLSEFSSAITDIMALRIYTEKCDKYLGEIKSGQSRQLIPFISEMGKIWVRLRVAIFKEIRESYDKRMSETDKYSRVIQRKLSRGVPFRPKQEDIEKTEKLYEDILMIRQNAGLGFSMRKEKTLDERLENVMR